jgi:hypothetical protein
MGDNGVLWTRSSSATHGVLDPIAEGVYKCGDIEVFNRILVGEIYVALRRGRARNICAYGAAKKIERHWNMSPNSANEASADEAPFRTSGIPLQNSKLVVILLRVFAQRG